MESGLAGGDYPKAGPHVTIVVIALASLINRVRGTTKGIEEDARGLPPLHHHLTVTCRRKDTMGRL